MKYIFILAKSIREYHEAVKQTAPGLERYHKTTFVKKGNEYLAENFTILPARSAEQVRGYKNWQLIKYINFWEHPDSAAIQEEYSYEVARRQK